MGNSGSLYARLGFWSLIYVALVPVAFYATYFSVMDESKPPLVHFHFAVMIAWLATSVAQPLLIRSGQVAAHRQLGRVSYVVLPLVVLTGYAMLRMGTLQYMQSLAGQLQLTEEARWKEGARYASLGTWYVVWPAIFYALAIVHRKKMILHSRYMFATILTVTGPIVDRIFFNVFHLEQLGPLPAECVSFLLIDSALLVLLRSDYRAGRSMRPLVTSLLIYLSGQLLFLGFMKSGDWVPVVKWLLLF